jgi:tryptophan synthase alpha chain
MATMNRINKLFAAKPNGVLSIYFTAGYPDIEGTATVIKSLAKSGVDFIEIGVPFSDPLADGPTIQRSSEIALENGMSMQVLFEQLANIRQEVSIPLLLMGYINPVIRYGIEAFCKQCSEIGIDGVILPDLPMVEYLEDYKATFEKYNLRNIFLITPQSSDERVRWIDENSDGFIYMVATAGTTGTRADVSTEQEDYFKRIKALNLKNPIVAGFGISDQHTFQKATSIANGAIIGSAFVTALKKGEDLPGDIERFVKGIIR